MPVVLDRLPLPNLTWYAGFSFLLLAFSFYYAGVQVSRNPNWKEKYVGRPLTYEDQVKFKRENAFLLPFQMEFAKFIPQSEETLKDAYQKDDNTVNLLELKPGKLLKEISEKISKSTASVSSKSESKKEIEIENNETAFFFSDNVVIQITPYIIPDVLTFMLHEPLCIWTLINMAYCFLILLGTTIQHLVFGELRVSEQQHIKDKFWNFVFYKFVFVFGVMNVQAMGEGILWCSWFSILGFLHLLAQLCKDRFEYLSFSPTTPQRTHFRLLGLLSIILLLATSCLLISMFVGFHAGINTFAFMLIECILLMIRTLYVITRYSIYLWDITHEGLWEKRGRYVYWTELLFELSELVIDMVHHIHMLVWANMILTMASLVICMQLRLLFYQLQHKIKSHKNYLRVVRLIKRYPEVRGMDIAADEDTCAICWEPVEVGRLLDCSHLFHSSCLLAWLHHDISCPTCRHKLSQPEQNSESSGILGNLLPNGIEMEETESTDGGTGSGSFPSPAAPEGMSAIDGWRYVSWLPSFSVEQNHTQLPRHHQANAQPVATSQLDNLARQAHQMFPDVSYSHILEDLHHTRSIEDTIDNLLEHRLVLPPPMFSQDSEMNYSEGSNSDLSIKERHDKQMPNLLDSLISSPEEKKETSSSEQDSECSDDHYIPGSYFSKSPREREQVLSQRKEFLLSRARQRFLSKKQVQEEGPVSYS